MDSNRQRRLEALRTFAPKTCERIPEAILGGNAMQRLEFLCERGHRLPWGIRRWARRQRKLFRKAAAGDLESQMFLKVYLSPESVPTLMEFMYQYGHFKALHAFLDFASET